MTLRATAATVPRVRVVVTGLIATYPVGGVTWDYVQYVRGLVALGHDVTYLEDTGQWVYSPRLQTFTDASGDNLAYLAAVMAGGPVQVPWAFRDPHGVAYGLDHGALVRAYVDTEPCYSQATLAAADAGSVTAEIRESAAMIRGHDVFFSFAENLGRAECAIPTAGLTWHPTRHPIVLDDWPVTAAPADGAFTTVMSWKTDVTPPVIEGRVHGGKDVELTKILDLPRRTTSRLEIGEGLFAFCAPAEAVAATAADDPRHSRAARALAVEHFAPGRVLAALVGTAR